MAKKKKKQNSKKSFWSFFGKDSKKKSTTRSKSSARKNKSKTKTASRSYAWAGITIVLILLFAGIAWGFRWLEDYVKSNRAQSDSSKSYLVLADKPNWVNLALENRIFNLAKTSISLLALDDLAAKQVAMNLSSMEWLNNVRVQTTHDSIMINADYRKPEAFISYKDQRYFVDNSLTVLSYVPMPELGILEIKGYHAKSKPTLGSVWRQDDIEAGIRLIKVLDAMDKARKLAKPLLSEIAYLDVSNYGSRDARKSQLVLVAKDGTKILWGAPLGKAKAHLEADEAAKLQKLYSCYELYGTLQGVVRYIDPRVPEDAIPTPGI